MEGWQRERFLLHSRTREHKTKVAKAREAVTQWLACTCLRYVSFSAGKDSTCTLALVREQARGTLAVYWDAACAFPEVETLIAQTPHCLKYPAAEPFLETLSRFGVHCGTELERATMRSTVTEPIKAFLSEVNCDGAAYGLRAEESYGRLMNRRKRGPVFYSKQFKVWMCQPVCDWSYLDVWAFIVSNDLAYCGTYDRMWDLPEAEQRISYWAGETNRQQGRWLWLRRNYPALWSKLRNRLPEAEAYA